MMAPWGGADNLAEATRNRVEVPVRLKRRSCIEISDQQLLGDPEVYRNSSRPSDFPTGLNTPPAGLSRFDAGIEQLGYGPFAPLRREKDEF